MFSRGCGTRGLLTLRSLSPDAGRGADAEHKGNLEVRMRFWV